MEEQTVYVTEHSREHLLTVPEFAELTRVHPLTVYRLIREGKLRGIVLVGGAIRINRRLALSPVSYTA